MNHIVDFDNTHTISLLVVNKPGVLYRITMVFARRGYNIESLVVSSAMDGKFSRITITAKGDPKVLEQIIKQCNKLIDILHAEEYDPKSSIEKELALVKLKVTAGADRTEVLQICEHFKGITVDFTDESLVIQVTGNTEKVDACVLMLEKFNLQEVVRTGKVLVRRGLERT
jgi:acetolactate synthase-1/3 small subunit